MDASDQPCVWRSASPSGSTGGDTGDGHQGGLHCQFQAEIFLKHKEFLPEVSSSPKFVVKDSDVAAGDSCFPPGITGYVEEGRGACWGQNRLTGRRARRVQEFTRKGKLESVI